MRDRQTIASRAAVRMGPVALASFKASRPGPALTNISVYGQLGQQLASPDPNRVKRPDNYAGRIVAAIFSLGIYMFWWYYNRMEEPNRHFAGNWAQEDELVKAVDALS